MLKEKIFTFIAEKRELLMTSVVALICLALFSLFPVTTVFQSFSRALFFFVIVPLLYIKLILHRPLRELGFTFPTDKTSLFWALGMLFLSLAIGILAINLTALRLNYNIPGYALDSFWWFIFYEFVLVNFIFLLQEIFFKGFLLFSIAKEYDYASILISSSIFYLFLYLNNAFIWQMAPIIIISIIGGFLAFKNKSFVHSYLMGLLFFLIFDAYLIYILK